MTIHPFDDGNGRIARAIADMSLARSEESSQRFYSMSARISEERGEYYRILERTQKGTMDVTPWMEWFLGCLTRAIEGAQAALSSVIEKARYWETVESGMTFEPPAPVDSDASSSRKSASTRTRIVVGDTQGQRRSRLELYGLKPKGRRRQFQWCP